ncbi:MAG: hypothetical protein F6J87_27635, partial [Spirulina sp. SIO3F2]|nr:hypothetical protein [Spirulina sp. SIO3F2]
MAAPGNSDQPIPERVTLVRPNPSNPSSALLFIDQTPVPQHAWSYDAHDKILRWQGRFGGGQLHFVHNAPGGGYGVIGSAEHAVSVSAGAKAQFTCAVALDCGVSYKTSGKTIIGLDWDISSSQWTSAKWNKDRLLLTYTVTPQGPILPPKFAFKFTDKETGASPWEPKSPPAEASLNLRTTGALAWDLMFKSSLPPSPPDTSSKPITGPQSVYPYWLQAVEDAAESTINGALVVEDFAPQGTLVGMQGTRANPMVSGYYQTSSSSAPFAIFDGRLHVDTKPMENAYLKGNTLHWQGLNQEHQNRLGLSESGSLEFSKNGSIASSQDTKVAARRLSTRSTLDQVAKHKDLHPEAHAAALLQTEALADSSLTIYGLLAMTPFGQNNQGAWSDVVQGAVQEDLSTIMNSFVSSDIWSLLFPNEAQPTLSGELAEVANSPVPGVTDPTSWYQSLGTAV